MKINVRVTVRYGCPAEWRTVEAELIKAPAKFAAYRFALHRAIDGASAWCISSVETGHIIAAGRYKTDAARNALAALGRKGPKALAEAVEHFRKRGEVPPEVVE